MQARPCDDEDKNQVLFSHELSLPYGVINIFLVPGDWRVHGLSLEYRYDYDHRFDTIFGIFRHGYK